MSLTNKSLTAVFWSAADIFLRQGMKFFIGLLLARLLLPEDFGVIAMLYVFIGVADVFIDSGFSSALIQKQDTTLTDESTVFFFNLGLGAIAAVILCASAPWIALFFKSPILKNISYVMALNLFIGALGSIHTTLLSKELNFKVIMKIGGVAMLCSGMLAVVLAWRGFGVWSLAWQTLASSLITVMLLWYWHPWRPLWEFNRHSLRRLFRFGGFIMLSGLMDILNRQLSTFLIGKLFSVRDLGFYSRAENTQQLPVSILTSVLSRVAFPMFSTVATDKDRLALGLRKAIIIVMLFNIPVMLGLAVIAVPLFVTLLGVKWLPSVPIFQVLCLVGMLWPLQSLNLNLLMAQGRSDLFFRLEMIKRCITIPLIVLASFHSVLAITWCHVFNSVLCFFINAHYSGVLLGYGSWRQLRAIMPIFLVSMLVAVIVALIGQLLHWTSAAGLLDPLLNWSPVAEWLELLVHLPFVVEWVGQLQHWPPAAQLATLSIFGAIFYFITCYLLRVVAFDEFFTITGRLNFFRTKSINTSR